MVGEKSYSKMVFSVEWVKSRVLLPGVQPMPLGMVTGYFIEWRERSESKRKRVPGVFVIRCYG